MLNGARVDIEVVRQMPLFQRLAETTLQSVADAGRLGSFPRGECILGRGDSLEGFFVVCDGSLKVYMLSCAGSERILRVLQPGDSFGEDIMFNAFPSPVFVDALAAAHLAFFPREAVTAALQDDAAFSTSMFHNMSRLIGELIRDIEACCLMTAQQRTIAYLLRETESGGNISDRLELPASKWIVASMLNLSPETFSRELHRLQGLGLIRIVRRLILIRERAGLLDMASGQAAADQSAANA